MDSKRHYIYLLIDKSKEVNIETNYGIIEYQPFYVGKGTYTKLKTERYLVHYHDAINHRNINPHKERKIRKLLKDDNFHYQILYESNDNINDIEIELISILGRKCINKKGLLTNISPGGDGGYVWKDNPIAVENIRKANQDKWKGDKNPNSRKNRDLKDSPSHKASLNNNHWNKGRFRQYYEMYDSKTLVSIGIFNREEILNKFNIKYSTLGASICQGKAIKNSFYARKIDSNLRIRTNPLKKLIDNGIVRTACIILDNKEYAEIDRNSLSPLKEE